MPRVPFRCTAAVAARNAERARTDPREPWGSNPLGPPGPFHPAMIWNHDCDTGAPSMAKLATTSKGARRSAKSAGEIERRLRRYYDVGKKSPKDSDGKPTYSKHDTKYHKARLRDCCRFADAYEPCELGSLLKLRSQQGTPLSWSVVRLLLTVENEEKRKKLQKRAAEENWSVIRTTTFIQAKINRNKLPWGGHPCSPPPDDVEELIQQIERFLGESKSRYAL